MQNDPAAATRNQAVLWLGCTLLIAAGVLVTAWYPLSFINSLPSKNYNEGWNAYRQVMALEGQPLYGSTPALWTTNYPFLSFHVIAILSGARDKMVYTGRIVSFASLIATSLFAGCIIAEVTRSRVAALYASLSLFAWLACFFGVGRAADDPEMLSLAFASLGLFAYFKSQRRDAWIIVSAIGFTLSLFTKHDLIALPLSIAADLLIGRNHRAFAIFCGAGAIASILLLIVSTHFDGPYFFAELLHPRAYSFANLIPETLHYLLHFFVPLLVAVVALHTDRNIPYRNFLRILLLFTNIIAIYFSGGDGVAANIFFAPIIANLLACVIAICHLQRHATQRHFQTALILTTLYGALMVPFQLRTDLIAASRIPAATKAAQLAIMQLKSYPGPAICEDLLLCYDAGKPLGYDPYYVRDQILVGRLSQTSILAGLAAHHYAVVQINSTPDIAMLEQRHGGRFSKPFLTTLFRQYRPVMINSFFSVFVPVS